MLVACLDWTRDSLVLTDDAVAALVIRARNGDASACEELVRGFLRPAYAVALSIVARTSDAEDVAQDAVMIAFEKLDTCREPARFAGWLLQIVRNQARNFLDRRRLRDVPADPDVREQVSGSRSDEATERRRLLQALDTLSPAQKEVVLLHDLEGWTHPEISAALGMSEVMSRQHLFQAHRELRSQLGEEDVGGGT